MIRFFTLMTLIVMTSPLTEAAETDMRDEFRLYNSELYDCLDPFCLLIFGVDNPEERMYKIPVTVRVVKPRDYFPGELDRTYTYRLPVNAEIAGTATVRCRATYAIVCYFDGNGNMVHCWSAPLENTICMSNIGAIGLSD